MPNILKQNTPFLVDSVTGKIVGVKNADGSETLFGSGGLAFAPASGPASSITEVSGQRSVAVPLAYAWADLLALTGVVEGTRAYVTDLQYTEFVYTGGEWTRPYPLTLSQSGIPVILAGSATIGNNGALSAHASLGIVYPNAYMHFPAGAIFSGSAAGKYYVEMSSATAGTIYNNTYTSGTPVIPASKTPFATTGPGAYVQTTGVDINLLSVDVLGGLLGKNGMVAGDLQIITPNNANNKQLKGYFGGQTGEQFFQRNVLSQTGGNIRAIYGNRGRLDRCFGSINGSNGYDASGLGEVSGGASDSSTTRPFVISAQIATAADYVLIDRYAIALVRA